jgi:excisionase family DNA binding protein
MDDEILTLKEVAEYLKLAEKTAYRLAAEGKLPGFKVGQPLARKKRLFLAQLGFVVVEGVVRY